MWWTNPKTKNQKLSMWIHTHEHVVHKTIKHKNNDITALLYSAVILSVITLPHRPQEFHQLLDYMTPVNLVIVTSSCQTKATCHSHLLLQLLMPTSKHFKTTEAWIALWVAWIAFWLFCSLCLICHTPNINRYLAAILVWSIHLTCLAKFLPSVDVLAKI